MDTTLFTYKDDCSCWECQAYHQGRAQGRTDTLWLLAVGAACDEHIWFEVARQYPPGASAFATACVMQAARLETKRAALHALSDMGDERATAMLRGGL